MSHTVTTRRETSANSLSGYAPVRVSALRSLDAATVNLYVQYDRRSEPVLYCRAGCSLDQQHFLELADAGVEEVYVCSHDFFDFSSSVLDRLETFFQKESVPQVEKFAALQVAFSVEIEQSLRVAESGELQTFAGDVGRQLVRLLAASDVLPRDLYRIARHDFNTFAHVTNVSAYCVILAEQMGIRDSRELEQIAAAAMLHDVGKRHVPADILAKPGRLEPEEREIYEKHPQRGYEELYDRPGFEFGQLMMVYQHHERIDGKGYPVCILGNEIHPWAKILSVVNVFDVMTAKRGRRRLANLDEVLKHQQQQAGTQFDAEAVRCWISLMKKR